MKNLHEQRYFTILCFSLSWIFLSVADRNLQEPSLGYYYPQPKPVQSYYKKDACPPPDPSQPVSEDGTVTNPNENFGMPYYPCIYNFTELEGQFFLINGTYFPCYEPNVIDVLRVGGDIPKGVKIRKAVHQSIAVKFPSPNQSIPLVAALVTEGFILVTNTSTPYDVTKNLGFHRAIMKKIALRQRDTKPYSSTQVELAKELFKTLTTLVDSAERHMLAINRNQEQKKSLGPFIVSNIQTFSTPSTRALESIEDLHPDFIISEQIFGLGGSRFEFDDARRTSEKISELVKGSDVPIVHLGDLGTSPQQSSHNTLGSFNNIVELSRVAQREISLVLSRETEEINISSAFNFTYSPPLTSAYCNRPIDIDPRGHVYGGNIAESVGMGMVTQRPT